MSHPSYHVGIVGIGAVGTELVRLLRRRAFPCRSITILARSERREVIDGEEYEVRTAAPEAFADLDFAFFAGTEGAKGASQTLGWEAVRRGCVVIDNGDDFRMDPRVPLVVPEINPEALRTHQGLVANPNCSTIIALMALAPLHRAAGLRRVVACTYQAVSGSGSDAVRELEEQVRGWVRGDEPAPQVYPHPIAFNVLAQVGGVKDPAAGATSEELKLQRETRKILADDQIQVISTCVRVPVFTGHTEALHVELRSPLDAAAARRLLEAADGVTVLDDMAASAYPTPRAVAGQEPVLVGRIRPDPTTENGLALVVAGDNLWKGAALNAIQIAEQMIALEVARTPASPVGGSA